MGRTLTGDICPACGIEKCQPGYSFRTDDGNSFCLCESCRVQYTASPAFARLTDINVRRLMQREHLTKRVGNLGNEIKFYRNLAADINAPLYFRVQDDQTATALEKTRDTYRNVLENIDLMETGWVKSPWYDPCEEVEDEDDDDD